MSESKKLFTFQIVPAQKRVIQFVAERLGVSEAQAVRHSVAEYAAFLRIERPVTGKGKRHE
jgi:hypothetical protein